MSKKRRKRGNKIPTKIINIENPILNEINKIKNKIETEENKIKEINEKRDETTSQIADFILRNEELSSLLKEYTKLTLMLDEKNSSQKRRQEDLSKKEKKYQENPTIEKEVLDFKETTEDSTVKMGLYNKPCHQPVAFCTSHNVFLSYKDTVYKKCYQKRKTVCKNLKWIKGGLY